MKRPIILAITLCFITTFCWATKTDTPKQSINGAPLKQENNISLDDVKRFSRAFSEIKRNYFKPINDKELFKHAIKGMLTGLDPHSAYLDIDTYKNLQDDTKGEFGGLGIEITGEDGYIKVISPIDDTPAMRAGVEAGDLIIRLNNKPVKGMSMRDALKTMRGKKGTSIVLTIYRKLERRTLKIKVVRDIIRIRSVKSRMLEPGYGYIRLSQFQKPSASDMINKVVKLRKESKGKLKGLVLDLRNNPGGLLTSAVEVSDAFIDSDKLTNNKLIVYTKSRVASSQLKASATPGDVLMGLPMVVLINHGSASGSEIVAGALQDHHRALIVGTKSFGKGSVQSVIPLDENHGIKLTTAIYYTPSGRSIQAKGIEPDISLDNVKVTKLAKEDDIVFDIRESDLNKHIKNDNSKSNKKAAATENKSDTSSAKKDGKTVENKKELPLIEKDYHLFQALSLLKGMYVYQHINDNKKSQVKAENKP